MSSSAVDVESQQEQASANVEDTASTSPADVPEPSSTSRSPGRSILKGSLKNGEGKDNDDGANGPARSGKKKGRVVLASSSNFASTRTLGFVLHKSVRVSSEAVSADHELKSMRPGESEVEQMAQRVEERRENRIPVSFDVRKRLLVDCRQIAETKGYEKSRIDIEDLKGYRAVVLEEVKKGRHSMFSPWLDAIKVVGFKRDTEVLLNVLDRALDVVESIQLDDDDWFHYQDFSFYYTRVESRWPWMRSEVRVAFFIMFLYYMGTWLFFCHISHDVGVCEPNEEGKFGWVSALYFASTTLSTVGYGDLHVTLDGGRARVFTGAFYMIISIICAITAFSAAAGAAFDFGLKIEEKIITFVVGELDPNELLYKRTRRIKAIMITEVVVQFMAFNVIGVIVSQLFRLGENEDLENWTWMTSFYWAVQTTTTIGYGDLNMSFQMRWFQIFYLALGTYFVGSVLGKLGDLKNKLQSMRIHDAWNRRQVNKSLVDEMQAYEHDDKVDQFEFLVASLLNLEKISSDDVRPIMNKFRQLCEGKGYIQISSLEDTCKLEDEPEERIENHLWGL